MSSTRKKVIVQTTDGRSVRGYATLAALGRADLLDLLTPDGEHAEISLGSVRCIFFVSELDQPVDLSRKAFLSRPKLQGLWVRLTFRDGDSLEGVVPNDLLDLLDNGVQITPPDFSGNCQRVFAPRSALAGVTVLGVVGVAATRRPAGRKSTPVTGQRDLFSEREA